MSKRTDTNEATQFQGTVTVTASANPVDYGGGNIELEGALFSDTIMENTDNVGVNLEGTNFSDNYFTMTAITAPSNPPLGQQRVYVDIADSLLKTRSDTGVVTVYQPLNTKGDLLTHNGTTQVTLPVGADGLYLVADSAATEGIKWDNVTVTHGALSGLLNDDHTQYALLAGRTGGQILVGGNASSNNLTIRSTSDIVKGSVIFDETMSSTSSTVGSILISGGISISNVTDAVDSVNGGTITTAGGAAIAKKLFIGTDLSALGITTLGTSTALTVSGSGVLTVNNTTTSTSTTTGSLIISGGVGISGALFGTSATFTTLSAPHSGLTGLTTGDPHTQYALLVGRTGGQTLTGGTASGNALILRSTTNATKGGVRLDETTAATTNANGALRLSGGLSISNTTDAVSASNGGTITTAGGAAIAKKLFVGTDVRLASASGITTIAATTPLTISAAGVLTINNTTNSTSTITGSVIISGGIGISGALFGTSATFTTLTAPHSGLTGLLNDDHTQYALLVGRTGGQTLIGGTASGNNLVLQSTSNVTKGSILVDETTDSTSLVTGAMIISGGLAITKKLQVGDTLNMNSNYITNLLDPINNNDAANKVYVDNSLIDLNVTKYVRVATDSPGTLATNFENGDTIDGVTLVTGDRILIKNQVSGIENGIYIVQATGTPLRSSDFALGSSQNGVLILVQSGTNNLNSAWFVSNTVGSDIVGTDSITFVRIVSPDAIIAGTGLTRTVNTLSVNSTLTHVTQVGTLSSLDITGNVNIASLNVSQPVFTDGSKNLVSVGTTGSGLVVLQTTPTLITPNIGSATGSSLNVTGALTSNSNTFDRQISVPQTITTSTNGSTALTGASAKLQFIVGSGENFSVLLPDSTSIALGYRLTLINTTLFSVTIYYNDGVTVLYTLLASSKAELYLRTAGTQNGVWEYRSIDLVAALALEAKSEADNQININQVTFEPTGFENRTDSVYSFDDSTRTFTIEPVLSTFNYWIAGVKKTISAPETVVISNTEGLHFIYFNGDTLTDDPSPPNVSLFRDVAYVAILYWDVTNQAAIYFGEERHGIAMDNATHAYLHSTQGSRYENGFGFGNFSVDGDGSSNTHIQFSVSNGKFWDEDIDNTVADDSPQNISPILNCPVFYKSGTTNWRRKAANAYPLIISGEAGYTGGNGLPAYNLNSSGTYSLAEVASGSFFNVYYFATNDIMYPIIGILGVDYYSTSTEARESISTDFGNIIGLPFVEFVSIGAVIFKVNTAYTNAAKAIIVSTESGEYIDLRDTTILKIGSAANYHGSLGGLSEDHHQQYLLVSGARAMSGDLDMAYNKIVNMSQAIITPTQIASTLNGNVNLTLDSEEIIFITGTATGFSITLPDATTALIGTTFEIHNENSVLITVKNNSGSTLLSVQEDSVAKFILQVNGSQNGTWSIDSIQVGSGLTRLNSVISVNNSLSLTSLTVSGNVNIDSLTESQAVFTDSSKNLVSVGINGSGNVVLTTSPTLVTPVLGVASGTSLSLTDTTDATSVSVGGSFTTPGGAAVAKQLFVGTRLSINGTQPILDGGERSRLFMTGPAANSGTGPHMMATVDGSIYPIFHLLNYDRDVVSLNFDMYYSGASYKLSNTGTTGFQITKISNSLQFNYSIAGTTGNPATLAIALLINNSGIISIGSTASSTSNSTGALLLLGGIGINNTTEATSTTNGGTITTAGGVAISKRLYTGGNIYLDGEDRAITVDLGSTRRLGIVKKSGGGPFFATASNASFDFRVANSTTIDNVSATTYTSLATLSNVGLLNLTSTTDASSSTSGGTFTTAGGMAVAKKLYVGGELIVGSSSTVNAIRFNGVTGDPGIINTMIVERLYDLDSNVAVDNDRSELLLAKFNDVEGATGADRIRHVAGQHIFSTYTAATAPPDSTITTTYFDNTAVLIPRVTIASNGQMAILSNITSTSTTTGSLIVTGGVGISGAMYAGSATFTTITAPHGGLTGLLSDDHPQYANLNGRTGGQIFTGGTVASNNLTIRSTSNATKGSVIFDETTATTSSTTGSLLISGGIGISNTTDAVSSTNGGSVTTAGGVAIAKKLFVGTEVALATVSGSTTIGSVSPITIGANGFLLVTNTIISNSNTAGSIRTAGGIGISNATDATNVTNGGSFTTAGGAAIAQQLFVGTNLSVGGTTLLSNYFQTINITAPSNPPASNIRFYTDSTDSLLKSKNSAGTVTTYQPTTTKGDLESHNGTTQVRVPVGLDNTYLIADSTQAAGLRWGNLINVYYIYEQQNQGTNGGSAVANSWLQRTLNTVNAYPTGTTKVTLSGSDMIFQPGVYKIVCSAPFSINNTNVATRLFNVTANAVALTSLTHRTTNSDAQLSYVFIYGILTFTVTSTVRLQYFSSANRATFGLGRASGLQVEKFSHLEIQLIN